MRLTIFCFILLLAGALISCRNGKQTPQQFVAAIPKVKPEKLVEFTTLDTLFFQHLAYQMIAMDDGSFVLGDRAGGFLALVSASGKLIRQMARKGKGPGEVLDITSITRRPGGGIIVYDQGNRKALLFDAQMKFEKEMIPEPFKEGSVIALYELGKQDNYLVRFDSFGWFKDKNEPRKLILAHYDSEQDSYTRTETLLAHPYAPLVISGQVAGGTAVPFSPSQVLRYNPKDQTFWIFWTASNRIAKINATYDTLQTVPLSLPRQEINETETDSLNREYDKNQWKTVREMLPEKKITVADMKVGPGGRFWLRLNYRSANQQWLIVNQKGEPQKIVELPKGSMLTHISSHHLGVRLSDGTFALYAPVQ